ncbi:hypothetical protein FO519_002031 [Halicephalobus sp. NKZ332]|nr:hypothetical protein FO519_002031 [Halicephalobus sp. NKZ332]
MKGFSIFLAFFLLSFCVVFGLSESPEEFKVDPRLRFYPNFSLQFPMARDNSRRARRANNLANMMRLGKRSNINHTPRALRNPIHSWIFSGIPQNQLGFTELDLGH